MIYATQNYVKRKFYRLKFPSTNVKRKKSGKRKRPSVLEIPMSRRVSGFFQQNFLTGRFQVVFDV